MKTRSEQLIYNFHPQTLDDPACFQIAHGCCSCGEWIKENDEAFAFDLTPDAWFCSDKCLQEYIPMWREEFGDKILDLSEEEIISLSKNK